MRAFETKCILEEEFEETPPDGRKCKVSFCKSLNVNINNLS